MTRVWWGFFAAGVLHVPFHEFTMTAYRWSRPGQ